MHRVSVLVRDVGSVESRAVQLVVFLQVDLHLLQRSTGHYVRENVVIAEFAHAVSADRP